MKQNNTSEHQDWANEAKSAMESLKQIHEYVYIINVYLNRKRMLLK